MPHHHPDPSSRLTDRIIEAATAVHVEVGPGLVETAYQACLEYELRQRRIRFLRDVPVPFTYRGVALDCGHRIDFLVEEQVVVAVRSVPVLAPIHLAQVITSLRRTELPLGLVLNFNVTSLACGVRRIKNRWLFDEDGAGPGGECSMPAPLE